MCGICGIINYNSEPVQERPILEMMRLMKHRGPDDDGVYLHQNIGLGSVRLSILDLSPAGHMPMVSDDGRFVIVYNGEIYNYIELRNELESKYKFRSNTDTEVLLNAYREWGVDCLQKFNGMFSFSIFDTEEKMLFSARDRYGIKPFYYYEDGFCFIFSSELKPLISVLKKSITQNDQIIFDFLVFNRSNHAEDTFFKQIKKLKHSHYLIIKNGSSNIKRWYNLKDCLDIPFKTTEDFKAKFISSVGLRLRSDVPVGACLSGGLDSSSIVSAISKHSNWENLHTFSAVYEKGMKGDESEYISEFNDMLRQMHFIRPSAASLFDDLNTFVSVQQEPVSTTSVYAEFKVMQHAKDYVTVILNGQGADEAMAGYHYFFGFYFKDLFRNIQWRRLGKELFHYCKDQRSFYGILSWFYLMLPSTLQTKFRTFEKGFFLNEFVKQNEKTSLIPKTLYHSPTLHEALLDHFEYKLEHLLIRGDRNSMWHSLELRFPFLDHQIVEGFLSLTNEWVIRNGQTKYLLREAMRGFIPEKIRIRKDKVGFETPDDTWIRTEKFQCLIRDIISSKSFKERGYFDVDKVQRAYDHHVSGRKNIGKEVWKWINLELWFREFVDGSINDGLF